MASFKDHHTLWITTKMSKLQGLFVQYRIHRNNLFIFWLDKGAFSLKVKLLHNWLPVSLLFIRLISYALCKGLRESSDGFGEKFLVTGEKPWGVHGHKAGRGKPGGKAEQTTGRRFYDEMNKYTIKCK
jgi:hypothetical protein